MSSNKTNDTQTTDWTSHRTNIVLTLQQKSDGRIRHPYTYYRSILNHQPNIDQLWAPSRHVFIFPPATTTTTTTTAYQPTSSSQYPTTTHMDVFQPQNTYHHNTDQFLITINANTTSSQKSNIAIYNLWDDQNHSALPQRSIVSSRLLSQRRRPRHDYHQVNDDTEAPAEFRPIQETLFTTTAVTTGRSSQNHLLSGLQWYPIDTGTFITTTISNGGYVTLWDTNHMIPVLNCQPFIIMNQNNNAAMTTTTTMGRGYTGSRSIPYGRAFRGRTTGVQGRGRPGQRSIQQNANDYNANDSTSHNGTASGIATMHIGTPQPYLVATGSHRSDMTKIVDLRSGSTSHTLMIGTSTSFMYDRDHTGHSSSRHHRDHHQCVTSVQWSPIQSNTLATCTNGNCYVWDIRSTVQPIAIGQYDEHCTNRKDGISVACHSMDAQLSQRRRRGATRDGPPPPAPTPSHHIQEFYETLKFDHTGQYLITLSKIVKDPRTAYMTVFDLLSPSSSSSEVPVRLVASTRQYYSTNSPRHDRSNNLLHSSVLFLTGRTATDQNVWFSASDSTRLTSYPMRPQHDDDDDDDAQPRNELIGHMGRIRCGAVMTGPNGLRQRPSGTRVNHHHLYAPHTIVTAADDGVMLVWEPQLPRDDPTPDDPDSNHPHKRSRLSMNPQQLPRRQTPPASATGDYDTWI